MSEMVHRAVQVLDVLAHGDGGRSVRTIADDCGLSKSAVQRLLRSLVETRLAAQDAATGRYHLGPRTLVLGAAYQRSTGLSGLAMPYLAALRDDTGETVGLSVESGEALLHVAQVESAHPLRRTFDVGRPLPLWCGAPSRLFLAERDDDEVRLLARERRSFPGVVPADPPSAEDLVPLVVEARRTGWAVARGETVEGANTVAVPIRGPISLVATVSVTGPAHRIDEDAVPALVDRLLGAAAALGAALGGAPAHH